MSTSQVPDRPSLDDLAGKWSAHWDKHGTYTFDRTAEHVYAIDTPPPTVSGSLHIGHVFSYTHADIVARYQRMRGRAVFYPMGWDDNGLPTERRVENVYGVRCDPALPYDPHFTPPGPDAGQRARCSRRNFVALCHELTAADEQAFEELWRLLGLSVDWELTYTTIGDYSRTIAQRFFLDQLATGQIYAAEAPIMWDVTNETAVAQAELEDREVAGAFHRLRFPASSAEPASSADPTDGVEIETTRPELLPACVALVAHPDDERYAGWFGRTVRTPLFDVEVPVLAHRLADPAKGTGIAMICTFGDVTDVVWWRELGLPTRAVTTKDGRIGAEPPPGVPANAAWTTIAGARLPVARKSIVELLRTGGFLVGEPRPISHSVKFYERGADPIEIVTSRQWYLTLLEHRTELRRAATELDWLPPHMGTRLLDWIDGLHSDWLLSRQRFFGVPIPLWYPLRADGTPDHDHPLLPGALPVDPSTDTPPGYTEADRDVPGGFTGERDVLDTWATSSLSPMIAGRWLDDPELFGRIFPMQLRPQSHEIIRTWVFYTLARSLQGFGALPWRQVLISGWVVDPDRKKMSKSKGNVTTPRHLLERYSPDALRHWAAGGRPGTDTAFDEAQLKIGRRLATKVLNASKFVLGRIGGTLEHDPAAIAEPLDRAWATTVDELIGTVTAAYEAVDYTGALTRTEAFFWSFCDDYLELVKERAYGPPERADVASAHATLAHTLSVLLRLFAPVLPFVTEEVHSWQSAHSVHHAPWPQPSGMDGARGDAAVAEVALAVLREIRRAKSAAKRSMKAPVPRLVVADTAERLAALRRAEQDLRLAGSLGTIDYVEAAEFAVTATLGEPEERA